MKVAIFSKLRLLIFLLIGFSSEAFAHNAQPCYLEIQEMNNSQVHITWKNLITDKSGQELFPQTDNGWTVSAPNKEYVTGNYVVQEWTLKTIIKGETIFIPGLEKSDLVVLVRILYKNGTTETQLLSSSNIMFTIKDNSPPQYGVSNYLWLGIEHIWTGIDHLLFVFGLLLLVKNKRSLLKTITAFTIAHSITLALAMLGWVRLVPAPVEAVIALSIVFLALELIRHYEGINRLTVQFPWLVAFAFGLLHGFGFAGALSEVGLPQYDVPLALLLFNVGVEIGQILFVGLILFVGWLIKKQLTNSPKWVYKIPPYVIGSMAAFWFIERLVAIFQ